MAWNPSDKKRKTMPSSCFLMPSQRKYPYAKSNYAIQAICEGFTGITEYLNDFNANQIAEIYAGMKDGVDYKIYAKPEYSAESCNLHPE